MGVFDEDGTYIEGTALDRRSGEIGEPMPRELFPDIADSSYTEAIYAGTLYFHFGHFLLESLARLWYAKENPSVPVVWAGSHSWQAKVLERWQREILDILGIENETYILHSPERFRDLHVPDIGYRYDDWFHPQHARFLGRYVGPAQEEGRKLWLSRDRVGNDVKDLNARTIEGRLSEAGWTIAHPESLSVREQLDEISRASVIAGEEGSAFHSLILLADVADKDFEVIRRHGAEHRNLHTIGDARSVRQTFHTNEGEKLVSVEGRRVVKISPNPVAILDALGVPVRDIPIPVPIRHQAELIEAVAVASSAKRVLEIGARVPAVTCVRVGEKRAVTERFDVDPRQFEEIEFFELAFDTYLAEFANGEPADLIVIPGSDPAEVGRYFRESLSVAHARSIWMFTGDIDAISLAGALAVEKRGAWVLRVGAASSAVLAAAAQPQPPVLRRLWGLGIARVPEVSVTGAVEALLSSPAVVEPAVVRLTVLQAWTATRQAFRVAFGLARRRFRDLLRGRL
jgi:hypothetical protein